MRFSVLLGGGVALALALTSCGRTQREPVAATSGGESVAATRIEGKSVLMVIAQEQFRDEELSVPKEAFETAGARVTVAAPAKAPAKGMLGATVMPDLELAAVSVEEYDAVVFVGGVGAQSLFDDPTAHALAKGAAEGGKVVAAICLAPSILARAGLLDGRRATVWMSEKQTLSAHGAEYTGEAVTVDGSIVTANGPEAAGRFAHAVINALVG